MPLDLEREVPPYCTVAEVRALGWREYRNSSKHSLVRIRDRFPRVVVEFVADENGQTHPLSLPTPRQAYVHRGMLLPC